MIAVLDKCGFSLIYEGSAVDCEDLFDAHQLLRDFSFDRKRLRLGFIVYGGASRGDIRKVTVEDIAADTRDVEQQLVPMLRADVAPGRTDIGSWTNKLVEECRGFL